MIYKFILTLQPCSKGGTVLVFQQPHKGYNTDREGVRLPALPTWLLVCDPPASRSLQNSEEHTILSRTPKASNNTPYDGSFAC